MDTAGIAGIPAGTRSVSVFLVNRRTPDEGQSRSRLRLPGRDRGRGRARLRAPAGPAGRAGRGTGTTGSPISTTRTRPSTPPVTGVSADWDMTDGVCRRVRSVWIPSATVEKTDTVEDPSLELSMEKLGALGEGGAAEAALRPLVGGYRTWIDRQRDALAPLQGSTPGHGGRAAAPPPRTRRTGSNGASRCWPPTGMRSMPSAWRIGRLRARSASDSASSSRVGMSPAGALSSSPSSC